MRRPVRKIRFCILMAGAALAIFDPAQAAVWCPGTPASVLVAPDGGLQADWGYGPFLLCNLSVDSVPPSPLTPIGAQSCRSIQAMLLTGLATGLRFEALLPNDSTAQDMSESALGRASRISL